MTRPPDILIRVTFELRFHGKNMVTQIQDRVSSFSVCRFPTLIEDGLAALSKDRLLIFDHVELEVGEVRISRLEDDLAAGIAKGLRRWAFSARPSSSRPFLLASHDHATDERNDARPTGGASARHRPKQAASNARGLNAAIAAALDKPGEWPEFLSVLRDNHALRCRLADEVSPKLLRRLLATLIEDRGPRIADVAEALIRLHDRHALIPVTTHVFRRELWECILAELAGSATNQFAERSFIAKVLKRLARAHLSDFAIAANLSQALKRQPARTAIGDLMSDAISELKTDKAGKLVRPLASAISDDHTASVNFRRLADFQIFLESGVLPWSLIGRDPEGEMLELLSAAPRDVCLLIGDLSETESVRRRLANQFSGTAKRRLLTTLAPTAASWMLSFMHRIRRVHAQKQLVAAPNLQFANDLWELCFEYLAQRREKNFDPRSFLHHLLTRMAERRKTSYRLLISDLALRRGPESSVGIEGIAEDTQFGQALVALFDQRIFGTAEVAPEVSRSLINRSFRSSYSDLDVLAHWLRWHKLPGWSSATDPERTGRRLGSLLGALPPEIQAYTDYGSVDATGVTPSGGTRHAFTLAEQIKHWLAFGLWPGSVSAPDSSQLLMWLESQSDADWLKALEAEGPQEAMVVRLSHHASASLFERITRLLSGRAAGIVSDYIRFLDVAGRKIAPVASQLWANQLKKYTLIYLLQTSSTSGRHAISVVELARSTMLALSLNCRVSYERLLDGVELQSQGQEEITNICNALRQELETCSTANAKSETIPSSSGAHDMRLAMAVQEQEPQASADSQRLSGRQLLSPDARDFRGSTTPSARKLQLQTAASRDLEESHSPTPEPTDASAKNDVSRKLAALSLFLHTGHFPNSADAVLGASSSKWITPCLSHNPQLVLETLKAVAAQPEALSRLLRYVSPSELEQIVCAAAPKYGDLLVLYINAGSRWPETGAPAGSRGACSRSRTVHWHQTLAFLLDKHLSTQSAAGILRELTVRVSCELAIAHDQYLSGLLQVTRERKADNGRYVALANMLELMLPKTAPLPMPLVAQSGRADKTFSVLSAAQEGNQQQNEILRSSEGVNIPADTSVEYAHEPRPELPQLSSNTAISVHDDSNTRLNELIVEHPTPEDALLRLDYLLRYGELPENASNADQQQLMARISDEIATRSIEYRRYLLKCAGRELERKRMARFFPARLLARLWPLLLPAYHANAALCTEILEEAQQACSTGGPGPVCHEIVVEELFKAISNSQAHRWDDAVYLRSAVERLSDHLSMRPAVLVKHMRAALEKKPASARRVLETFIDRIDLEFAATPPLRAAQNAQAEEQKPRPQHPTQPPRSLPEGEPFYIANAGLVLLWPFLQTYFQRLELLDKSAFRDDPSKTRAIHLLQYLTSGAFEASEHELLLNKILVGWAIEQPLECPSPLTENERGLSEQLLQGVLKNWEKLKGTSVEGLRGSFLMREGKLVLNENQWSLTVSIKAYDILLDSLPWSYKMIRLPWMTNLL